MLCRPFNPEEHRSSSSGRSGRLLRKARNGNVSSFHARRPLRRLRGPGPADQPCQRNSRPATVQSHAHTHQPSLRTLCGPWQPAELLHTSCDGDQPSQVQRPSTARRLQSSLPWRSSSLAAGPARPFSIYQHLVPVTAHASYHKAEYSSGKTTPCQIPTYTGISRDNPTSDLSRDIPV